MTDQFAWSAHLESPTWTSTSTSTPMSTALVRELLGGGGDSLPALRARAVKAGGAEALDMSGVVP